MKENGTVREATKGQVAEIFSNITKAILSCLFHLSFDQAKWLTGHKRQLTEAIKQAIESLVDEVRELPDYLAWWQEFYREEEGIEVDFRSFKIPPKPKGDWWLIIIAPGMTYNKVIEAMRKKFKVWVYNEDLDKAIDLTKEQRRTTDELYTIWVKANVEADPELKNKSANDLKDMKTITLMERLLLEIFYFSFVSDGSHLDVDNVTLCAGSRSSDGGVPSVNFRRDDGGVSVRWMSPDNRNGSLRSRQAVSS